MCQLSLLLKVFIIQAAASLASQTACVAISTLQGKSSKIEAVFGPKCLGQHLTGVHEHVGTCMLPLADSMNLLGPRLDQANGHICDKLAACCSAGTCMRCWTLPWRHQGCAA